MSGIRITLEVKRANVCHSKNAKILTFEVRCIKGHQEIPRND